MTYAVISVLKSLIHFIKFLLYPKNSRTLYKNFHESESNAFSKSINISNLGIFKHPARDACLCMGDLQAPAAPPAPHFVFLITL